MQKLLFLLGAGLLLNAVFVSFSMKFTAGLALLYLLSAALLLAGWAYGPLSAFCARGPGRWLLLCIAGAVALYFFLLLFLWAAGRQKASGKEKALIVLGAGLHGEEVSDTLARRLDVAFAFWQQNPEVLLVVSGGQGADEAVSEAAAMARYLEQKGVPEGQILKEDRSSTTEENFAFSLALLEQNGVSPSSPIAFATNRFHCFRAGRVAADTGFEQALALPATLSPEMVLPCYFREGLAFLYYEAKKLSPF